MELKEYLAILRRQANLFLSVVLGILVLGTLFYFFQPVKFKVKLALNVTRIGQEKTTDYQFDDFYRLQADERFADTIVRWLETERMQKDIQDISETKESFYLVAKRLSSQMIDVEVLTFSPEAAEKIALAIPKIINQETEKLNQWQKKENWFRTLSDEPVISLAVLEWHKILLISLALGIFVAFWTALIRHYLE